MALTEDDVRRAEAEMEELRHSTATAVAVRHDRRIGRIVVRLSLNGTLPRGERNGNAKLTAEQVEEIRSQPSWTTHALAARFGVGVLAVQRIRAGTTWRVG